MAFCNFLVKSLNGLYLPQCFLIFGFYYITQKINNEKIIDCCLIAQFR